VNRRAELTFKHNVKRGRHGWIRLTPAYSVQLVSEILEKNPTFKNVLEPFSGTGTTGLVCAEHGKNCTLLDINPFLIWLARAKTATYSEKEISAAEKFGTSLPKAIANGVKAEWEPPIFDIERWWNRDAITFLSKLHSLIQSRSGREKDLLIVAFCKTVIETSNAAFNHQSMSFKKDDHPSLFTKVEDDERVRRFQKILGETLEGARQNFAGKVTILHADSREVPLSEAPFDAVITSPPYPNRMSYIRELRPYMYWLGYLKDAREAGELDWQAIGGTWGIATSMVGKWQPNGTAVPHDGFDETLAGIAKKSPLLANYVHKYFVDMVHHVATLKRSMATGGKLFYIVGNSKFYDTMVHVEEIYASIFKAEGFGNVTIEKIRKRNSKKELFEFAVSAVWPS